MQVPPSSAAASVASLTSQLTAKENHTGSVGNAQAAPADAADIHVDRSGASDPDRDAQGQGDGLPQQRDPREPVEEKRSTDDSSGPAALLPGELPSNLDIVG